MPRGANKEREHEYEELQEKFEDEGRYKGREEEMAARIVNKQRAEQDETSAAREEDKHGQSPDRDLPLKNYDGLTVEEISARLGKLKRKEVERLRDYEKAHRGRKTLLAEFDRHLNEG